MSYLSLQFLLCPFLITSSGTLSSLFHFHSRPSSYVFHVSFALVRGSFRVLFNQSTFFQCCGEGEENLFVACGKKRKRNCQTRFPFRRKRFRALFAKMNHFHARTTSNASLYLALTMLTVRLDLRGARKTRSTSYPSFGLHRRRTIRH